MSNVFLGIACVQFDDTRIVSGSSDKTIKVGLKLFHFFHCRWIICCMTVNIFSCGTSAILHLNSCWHSKGILGRFVASIWTGTDWWAVQQTVPLRYVKTQKLVHYGIWFNERNTFICMELMFHTDVKSLHWESEHFLLRIISTLLLKVWDLSFASYWAGASCKVTMVGHLHTVRCLQVRNSMLWCVL